ncbi:MAG: hypothetical protein QXG71_02735, partial [Nanopusillaceae archaeon]
MMNRKTLAGVGSLIALGTVVLAQTTPTLGTVRDAIKSEPHAWTVVVGKDAKASDVIGAADVLAALQTLTTKVEPIDLSAVKVVLERPIVVENKTSDYSSGVNVWNGTVTVNDTVYSYDVKLSSEGTFTSFGLNESGRLQLQNVGFKLDITFNGSIDKLNNTKINVFGKDFYLVVYKDSSINKIELRRIPVEEIRVRYDEEKTILGKRVKLVDIYEKLGENKIYVVLEVEGKTYEITSGETKVVEGLELTVVDAYVSRLDITRSYVVLGVGGGEKYVLKDGKIEDVNGNEIGTWSLSEDRQTLTLTFTKDYLFAGDSFDLPIFGGYRLVFKDYPLPLPGSEQVEIRSVRSETVENVKYYYYSLKFGEYELPLIVDEDGLLYVYSRDYKYPYPADPYFAMTILRYNLKGVQFPPTVTLSNGTSSLVFLGLRKNEFVVPEIASRLFNVTGTYTNESLDGGSYRYNVTVTFKDVLTGEEIELTGSGEDPNNISLGSIKIGNIDVTVTARVDDSKNQITLTFEVSEGDYTFEDKEVWFRRRDGFPTGREYLLAPRQKTLLFLGLKEGSNKVASRLFEVVGDVRGSDIYVEFTDVLTGEKIVLGRKSGEEIGKIKIGDKEVTVNANVPISGLIRLTFDTDSYNFEDINIWFITKNNGLVEITSNRKVTVNGTEFILGNDGYIEPATVPSPSVDITEGGVKYTIAVNTENGLFVKYKTFFTDYAVVYVPREEKSPETVIGDLMTEKVEKYEVSPGGKVEIEDQTISVKELTGLPKE